MAEVLPALDPAPVLIGNPAPDLLRVRLAWGLTGEPHLDPDIPRSQETEHTAGSAGPEGGFRLHVDFSLSTRRNVLFGPSGAGKSTLLRLLAGLLQPTDGTIVLGGLTLTGPGRAAPPGRRGIGYLTQDPALFPHLSVEGNLAYGLHALSRDARRTRVAEMLKAFSLDSLARRMPLHLSGGERQRVALARTLAPGPSLLLLDEPFGALDHALREKMTAALDQYLAARQTMVISVSHDVAEVYASGAEVLLLEAGRITGQGLSHQVLARHRERLLLQLAGRS